MTNSRKLFLAVGATAVLTAFATAQISQIIKVLGVGVAVQRFGPDIDRAFNRLVRRDNERGYKTKVVPIISGGINGRTAIGAAQVFGPSQQVDTVKSVAQLEQDLFGREVKLRAMVPIAGDVIVSQLKPVDSVAVTGIVDLKL
ncbi:MAG: hypothetical protein C4320_05165 [Armatimonadota bacterium]